MSGCTNCMHTLCFHQFGDSYTDLDVFQANIIAGLHAQMQTELTDRSPLTALKLFTHTHTPERTGSPYLSFHGSCSLTHWRHWVRELPQPCSQVCVCVCAYEHVRLYVNENLCPVCRSAYLCTWILLPLASVCVLVCVCVCVFAGTGPFLPVQFSLSKFH